MSPPLTPIASPLKPVIYFTNMTVLAITLLSAASGATAQLLAPGNKEGSIWGVGIGTITMQKPYTGVSRENKVLPLLYFENKYVRVFGPGFEAKLPSLLLKDSQRIEFRIIGQYDLSGYDTDDSPVFSGMSNRKSSLWIGAKMKWRNDIADVSAEWLTDATSYSKGQRFNLGIEKNWQLNTNLMLTPYIGVNWHDKKYVDYYFGVRNDEAMAGRSSYNGQSAMNTEFGVRTMYRFSAHHSALLNVGITSLASEIKNSPLVDRSNEYKVILGYLYRF